MAITFKCPSCQQPYKVKDDMAGKRVVCTSCKKPLRVPAPVAAPAVPSTAADELAAAALADAPAAAAEIAAATITVECPNCIEQVTFPAEKAGKQAPCPNCKRVIRVPIPATGKKDWRTADARPTFAKVAPEAELKGVVSTASTTIVSREALEEANALRKRVRDPWPIRTKITYAIIFGSIVALAVLGMLLLRTNRIIQRRDDLVENALKLVKDNAALPAGVRAETYRAAGEYVLATPDSKADVAMDYLRNARSAIGEPKSTDQAFERVALLTRVAVTQTGLVGNAEEIRVGKRVEWDKTLRELRHTLDTFDKERDQWEGIILAVRDLARSLRLRGPNDTPAIRALLSPSNRFDSQGQRADALAAAGLELFSMDEAGRKFAQELVVEVDERAGGELAMLPRVVALHAALKLREPTITDPPAVGVRVGLAEGYTRRGDLDAAKAIAAKPGSPEDRFQAHVAIAGAVPDNPAALTAAVTLFADEFKTRDLPDWPLIHLARLCAESKDPTPAKALNDALTPLANLSPRSQAVRAWAQMELRPSTVAAAQAVTPPTALGSLLAWEWLARRSGTAEGAPDGAKPVALVGAALGSLK
jgi:hypothetical protein